MKPIQFLTLTFCFLLISFYSYSQNLQFNSAVYYEYGGGISNGNEYLDIITSGTLTVGPNQVLKITAAGGSIGGPNNYDIVSFPSINGRTLSVETYLPSGTYTIGFSDIPYEIGEVKGYISGVLYDIIP